MGKTKEKIELPENCRDIMVTYEKTFYFGAYGTQEEKAIVTKRGFWNKLFPEHISVPPEWKYFNGVLLPHG